MGSEQQSSEVDLDIPIPEYVLYVVAISKVVYSGLVALIIMGLIGHYSDYGIYPSIEETLFTFDLVIWLITFFAVALITIVVGFKLWVYMSWFTGSLLYKPLRDELFK